MKILLIGFLISFFAFGQESEMKSEKKKDILVEVTLLPSVSLLPGRPALVVEVENSSDSVYEFRYSLIHNVERYFKVIEQESGKEIPNYAGGEIAGKNKILQIPPNSKLRFLVSAPNNKVFSNPVTGVYKIIHKGFGCSSAPFEVDLSMTPWVIKSSNTRPK